VGRYAFEHLPAGDFDLSVDADFLPADYAWDGRARRLAIKVSSRVVQDLVVAPLNAIHGRVYADRNGNGRYDTGEGVTGAVVALGDRVTATGADGGYDFFNVMPGTHTVHLAVERLPAGFEAGNVSEFPVRLGDDRPVVGADFVVKTKVKGVIWRDIK